MTLEDSVDRGTVRVEDAADQLDMLTEGVTVYLGRDTNAFVTLLDPMLFGELDERDVDPDDLDPERYLMLPSSFEIHEWAILRDFCVGVADGDVRAQLLRALHGLTVVSRNTADFRSSGVALLDPWDHAL